MDDEFDLSDIDESDIAFLSTQALLHQNQSKAVSSNTAQTRPSDSAPDAPASTTSFDDVDM